jgi:hypothetical protein
MPGLLAVDPTPVPPLRVLNRLLAVGRHDAGMSGGCTWRPFRLTRTEYPAVKAGLMARFSQLVDEPVPQWVRSFEDWHCYAWERAAGVPAQEHRRLWAVSRRLEKAVGQALARGDTAAYKRLHQKANLANIELDAFTSLFLDRLRARQLRKGRGRRRTKA